MGGAAGLVLGYLSRNLVPWLLRTGWDGGEMPVRFDWHVFGVTASVTLLTGIFFGIVPAWRLTHSEISTALKEGARSATRKRKAWSGKMIVAFQVALSTLQAIVLREVGWLALSGVSVGLLVTLALSRLVKAMLYGLSPKDPITLAGSALLLLLIALVAGWAPAHRAS